jgi:predicted transcriptional regulator
MDFQKVILEKGLKKGWIAKQIGISQVLLSYYLTKTRPMPIHVDRRLKEILS